MRGPVAGWFRVRRLAWVSACVTIAIQTGCSRQDFTRPISHNPVFMALDSGAPYVSEDDQTAQRAARLAGMLSAWKKESAGATEEYAIGVGDVLEVSVLSLETPGQVKVLKRTVNGEGSVLLPLVNKVPAVGMTAAQVRALVRSAYANSFLRDPQVNVTIADYRSRAVLVTGAVSKPGVFYIKGSRISVLELLAEAGGLREAAGDELLIMRGPRQEPGAEHAAAAKTPTPDSPLPVGMPGNDPAALTNAQTAAAALAAANPQNAIPIDLRRLIDEGDLTQNVWVRSGDILLVRPRRKDYIYVLGYVGRPGAFELPQERAVGLLQAVAMAGGLTPMSRAENSFLIRVKDGKQQVVSVDITKVAKGIRPDVHMRAGDTLVVGSGLWARLSEFVRPSVGMGASYSPAPP